MNFDEYIGIPFVSCGTSKEGCDCWRLICLVYRERLSINLPEFTQFDAPKTKAELIKVTRAFKENKVKWIKVNDPKPYDVILLRTGSMLYHSGLVIGRDRMIHIDRGINSTIEKYTSRIWKDKIEGFYRYDK
jgi:cell wall-associated NlpC family hydrolase